MASNCSKPSLHPGCHVHIHVVFYNLCTFHIPCIKRHLNTVCPIEIMTLVLKDLHWRLSIFANKTIHWRWFCGPWYFNFRWPDHVKRQLAHSPNMVNIDVNQCHNWRTLSWCWWPLLAAAGWHTSQFPVVWLPTVPTALRSSRETE